MSPTILWDLALALVLTGIPLFLLWRFRHPRAAESPLLWFLGAILPVVWAVVFYGSFIEPRFLTVRRFPVRLGDSGRHLTVAVISDTHLGGYREADWARRLVDRTNSLTPDLILLDGDLVTSAVGIKELTPFKGFRAKYGTYAALGNWDYRAGAVDVRQALGSLGIPTVTNRSYAVGEGETPLRLVGLDDFQYGRPDWSQALSQVPAGAPTILLAHNPDFAPQAEIHGMGLMISGHTHCGQIRLPFLGSVVPLPTHIGRRFDCGLFDYGQLRLFISAGAGESGPRARLFDPPEIAVLEVFY